MADVTLATYINQSVFSVSGEHTGEFTLGRKLLLNQGTDGIVPSTVYDSWYESDDNVTKVWTRQALITENLVSVRRGPADTLGTAEHYHTGDNDGGYLAASILADADISEYFWSMEAIRTETALETGAIQGKVNQLRKQFEQFKEEMLTIEMLGG